MVDKNKKTNEEMVKDVIDNFDFKTVKKVMDFLDWKWAICDTKMKVPTIRELKRQAEIMLISAMEGRSYSTGGFSVSYRNGILELKFILEEYYTTDKVGND